MRAIFVDANHALADVAQRLHRRDNPPLQVNLQPDVTPEQLPSLMVDAGIMIVDFGAPVAERRDAAFSPPSASR